MITDLNKGILIDLAFRTSLLESLDWDEVLLVELIKDLDHMLKNNIGTPKDIVNSLSEKYTVSAALIIENMFKQEYIINGLYHSNDEEN